MLRLASVSEANMPEAAGRAAGRFPAHSLMWLSGDLGQPQGRDQLRQLVRYLAEAIEQDPIRCSTWMHDQAIESLGGLTAEALVERGLGLLVVGFLLEILAGERG